MQQKRTDDTISLFLAIGRQMRQRCDIDATLREQVTIAQLEALRHIAEQKKVSMKDLGIFLAISAPSATVLIDRLVRLELVAREQAAANRRSVMVSLTRKGKAILHNALQSRRKKLVSLLKNLTAQEQKMLLVILSKMIRTNL